MSGAMLFQTAALMPVTEVSAAGACTINTNKTYQRLPINRNTICQVRSYDMEWNDLGTTSMQIALAHAGFALSEVTVDHEGRDTEYGQLVHDVEFHTDTREYDYVIDAETGEIVSFDEDAERYVIADWHRETPPSTDSSAFIGDDAAKAIALDDAGVAEGDADDMRIELDFDNRIPRYEVDFDGPDKAYEYAIDAVSGNIINFDTARF